MKKVIILSGVSGCGKSRYIETISPKFYSGKVIGVVSAYSYFISDKDETRGEYNFTPSEIDKAHAECFRHFIYYMTHIYQNYEVVWVDNTNTTVAEIGPYVLAAQAYGWEPEILTFLACGTSDLEMCAERNRHGVPLNEIKNQHKLLQQRQLPPWWKNIYIPIL